MRLTLAASALLLALTACASVPASDAAGGTPADAFFATLSSACGKAYAGRVVANIPRPAAPDPFEGRPLVMHVRKCSSDVLRIPFHAGDDRSRTWVVSRTGTGLRLKHDHRHQDGSPDALTLYGGDSRTPGSASHQEFPVDAESIALFERQGSRASVTNTWAMEVVPGQRFVYQLSRSGGRLFRVEFDLSAPVPVPPPPWGSR